MPETTPHHLPPASPMSESGESHQSRRHSWRQKLAPFIPKAKSLSRDHSEPIQPKIHLELHNTSDDDLLIVLRQVICTILESKDLQVTKASLYRVLRKFARCQVDLKTLEAELHRATKQLKDCQLELAVQQQAKEAPMVSNGLSEQQLSQLEEMIADLEQVHSQQRSKYEQVMTLLQNAQATTQESLCSTTQQRDQLAVELEQQRTITAVCEQVIQALRETLFEKDEALRQQTLERERLQQEWDAAKQLVADRDELIGQLQQQVNVLQEEVSMAEARAIGAKELATVAPEPPVERKPAETTPAAITPSYNIDGYEIRPENGRECGFMLSRFDEILQRNAEKELPSDKQVPGSPDRATPLLAVTDDDKPWRVDELRKRRDTQEEDMKQQLLRIGKASTTMTGGQATAQSPDRDNPVSAPISPSEREMATLKTHIAVQEALIHERDATIEELQTQIKDLSTKLDATVALTASLAMRDLARTNSGDNGSSRDVDHNQLEELQRTLKHSEGKVAKLKQELSLSKRKLTNSEQKIKLLETFIMEDLQDAVVLGEVTESQRRNKTLDSFEESTRSILDESQMVALEKEALKSEVYELKSQLKIAQAMVSDLEKDRKQLKARVAHIDSLSDVKENGNTEAKLYQLSLQLADMAVERDALAEELQMSQQRIERMTNANSIMEKASGAEVMGDISNESLRMVSEVGKRLSFFSAQEQEVLPKTPPRPRGVDAGIREGIGSLFAPHSLKDHPTKEAKTPEQRIADLEMENKAYAASVRSLQRQLAENMPGHYAK